MRHPWTLLLALAACGTADTDTDVVDTDVASTCPVVPPASWDAPAWDTNAATALALRAQLDALSARMADAEKGTAAVPTEPELQALVDAGAPSLRDVRLPAYEPVIAHVFAEFIPLATAGPQDLVSDAGAFAPGPDGGVFGAKQRGINEGGVEVRQLVDKGLFGGAGLYRWAAAQTATPVTPESVDAIAAAWGTNATMDAAAGVTDSANYSLPMGYFAPIAAELVAAKAYAADPACEAERDAAVIAVFRLWEASLAARVVYYGHDAATKMASADSDDDVAEAIHGLSEAAGLLAGFHGLDAPATGPLAGAARTVDDAALAGALAALGVLPEDLGGSTLGPLVVDPDALADAVADVEALLAAEYGWTEGDLARFRAPTAG